jgi:hypothetical protein
VPVGVGEKLIGITVEVGVLVRGTGEAVGVEEGVKVLLGSAVIVEVDVGVKVGGKLGKGK